MQTELYPYKLALLSGFKLEFQGQQIEIPGQKARALICVLALQSGKTLTRAYLAGLLWDGMDVDQATMNLRQTLSVIKRALGAHYETLFDVTRQTLSLRGNLLTIDTNSLNNIDNISVEQLMLFGNMGAKSLKFETWLSDQQSLIIKGTMLRTLHSLEQAIELGRIETALQLASRLHTIDPDNDHYTGQVHALMLQLGQNHEAGVFAKENPTVHSFEAPDDGAALSSNSSDTSPMILIGRFKCKPDDKAAANIAIALSEAVVGDLAESAWVRVIAPDLTNLSAPMFGLVQNQTAQLRWQYRLDGAIRSDPLSASIWLTNGADQTIVWTEKFSSGSIGALADDIVSRVTSSLESIVLDAEGKRTTHARNLSGYWENLARARMLFWRASQNANEEAESLLDKMLSDAPHDVRVLTLAAFAKLMNAWSGWQGQASINLDLAAKLSRRAIQSVPDDAWSLMTMATVLSARLDLVGAKRKLEQAIAIRPHLAAAKGEMARVMVFGGQTKAGSMLATEALDASPKDPHASLWVRTQAFAAWMDGQFAHAANLAELAIERRSNWYPNFLIAAVAHYRNGDLDAAKQAIASAKSLGSDSISRDALRCGHPFEDRLIFDQFVADLESAGWNRFRA